MSTATEFLEAEAIAAERRVKITAIVGVVLAVLITGYMIWIQRAIEQSMQPDVIADVATGAAVNMIPEIGEDVRRGLIDAAPQVARTLTGALIDAVPVMRHRLEDSIVVMTDDMAKASAEDVGGRLDQLLTGRAGAPEAALEGALAALIDDLDREVYGPATSKRKMEPDDKAGIFTSMRDSADQLRRINDRLRALANNAAPNADEAAMKRLITTWLGVVSPADEN